jgi:hypothetical protein
MRAQKHIPSSREIAGWLNLLFAFDEQVKKRHKNRLSPHEIKKLDEGACYLLQIFVSLRDFLHKRMTSGDVKALHITLKALGISAFYLPWFIDGLCQLLLQGKTFQLSLPRDDKKFLAEEKRFFRGVDLIFRKKGKGYKGNALLEQLLYKYPFNKKELSDSTVKTLLYRDYPERVFIYLFRKLFKSLMLYITCGTDLFLKDIKGYSKSF